MKNLVIFLLLFLQITLLSQTFNKPHILSSKLAITTEAGLSAPKFDYYKNKNDYIGRFAMEYYFPTTSVGIFGLKAIGGGGYLNVKDPKTDISTIHPVELRNSYYYGEMMFSYTFSLGDFLLPYIGTGISYLNFELNDKDGNKIQKYGVFNTTEINYTGEVGVKMMLANNLSLNLGVHTNISPNDNLDNLKTGRNDFFHSAFGGLTFYFGGKKDTDGDGYYDDVDKCPDQPEDFDGFQDDDGCPDPDNDNDGILDIYDKCPDQAEIYNGIDDQDGCPDGFVQKVKVDTVFVTKFIQQKEILPFIELDATTIFAPNTNTFGPTAGISLDTIVTFLQNNPSTNWRIECYTDSKAKNAKKLTTDRAAAVRDYFVARGVAKNRFVTYGMGSDFPKYISKDPNITIKNNRIILVRIK